MRVALQLALELRDALVLTRDAIFKAPDLLVHAQQHLDDDLAPCVVDGLRVRAVHIYGFDAPGLCPLPTERLRKSVSVQSLAAQASSTAGSPRACAASNSAR